LIEAAARNLEQAGKWPRLRAPLDRGELLEQQRQRQRREHVEMLIQTFENGPHRDDFGDDAENRAGRKHKQKADRHGHAHLRNEQRAQYSAQHTERARGKAEHARGRKHHVISDADQCIDAADRYAR
jgi:hypothetical protein